MQIECFQQAEGGHFTLSTVDDPVKVGWLTMFIPKLQVAVYARLIIVYVS
jgi:hypothetical protein